MKIYVLTENSALNDNFDCEHGLSLYVETKKHKILVDAGQSSVFLNNSKKLGLDLSQVDVCVLTHGHYDHSGGLIPFFEINSKAKVYANSDVFGKYYNKNNDYIGLSEELKKYKDRFVFVEEEYFIDETLQLFSGNDRKVVSQIKSCGYTAKSNSNFIPDDFHHEQYLIINDKQCSRVLISGCSHKGINNIMHWARYDNIGVFVGGFHLLNVDIKNNKDKRDLDLVVDDIMAYKGIKYYTGHCTGNEQYNYIKNKMGDRLDRIHAGTVLEF